MWIFLCNLDNNTMVLKMTMKEHKIIVHSHSVARILFQIGKWDHIINVLEEIPQYWLISQNINFFVPCLWWVSWYPFTYNSAPWKHLTKQSCQESWISLKTRSPHTPLCMCASLYAGMEQQSSAHSSSLSSEITF